MTISCKLLCVLPSISAGHTTKDFLPSYTVDLQSLTERVCNVKDIQFLHGYNSPTVFVLYEPIPTWAG